VVESTVKSRKSALDILKANDIHCGAAKQQYPSEIVMDQWNKILIVDDEQSSVRLLDRVLKNKYCLQSASSGEEALLVIPEFRPDLILLDIDMQGMNGYETCRRIREDKNWGLIKILLVSGYSKVEERLKGYEVGADDYVAKPFDNSELRAKVDVFMKLKRVEEVDNIKSDLLSLFAHETRTPLAGIIGISELLAMDTSLPKDTIEHISHIYKNAVDLYRFVEKAALLSNLKNGMRLQCIAGSVKQHLARIASERDTAARQKDITVTVDCPKDIELWADWNTLDEVIGYILDNAVKFSNRGGSVMTRADMKDNFCTIEIEDHGKGIDPKWIDTVFNEFSIKDLMHHQQGQGLSLAIAKHIVELHSGEISVTGKPGEGAVFTVRLPVSDNQSTSQISC
jgi:signal transduction histidine kinase